jgi:hypothetical protein
MKLGTMLRGAAGSLTVGCALALGSGSALAESACKGLEQAACEKAADCTWVGPYERKDGKQVSGYCRGKGGAAADDTKDDKDAAKIPAKPNTAKTPEMPAAKPKAPEAPAAAKTAKPVEMPAAKPKAAEAPAAAKTPKPIEMPSMPKTQPPPAAPAAPAAVKDKPKTP